MKPLLQWPGGKSAIAQEITDMMPTDFDRYIEPFVGGGAIWLSLMPNNALISDKNKDIIRLYQTISRYNPYDIYGYLQDFVRQHNEGGKQFYYALREDSGVGMSPPWHAARMLFLSKTSFNGLYRVNKSGKFNVPYGRPSKHVQDYIVKLEQLLELSDYLTKANIAISCKDFEDVLREATPNDFVYLDPPYVPTSTTASFTAYTPDGFTMEDQRRLRDCLIRLREQDTRFILSNSDTPETRRLYEGFDMQTIGVKRGIKPKLDIKKHQPTQELLIYNL